MQMPKALGKTSVSTTIKGAVAGEEWHFRHSSKGFQTLQRIAQAL